MEKRKIKIGRYGKMKRNQNWFSTGFLSIMILAAGAASRVWGVSYTAIDLNPRKPVA